MSGFLNLVHTTAGFKRCEDVMPGDVVYSMDAPIEVTKPPVRKKCWRIATDIKLGATCEGRHPGRELAFCGTHAYSPGSDYGYYAMGYMQTTGHRSICVTNPDTVYRLTRSMCSLIGRFPNMILNRSGGRNCIVFSVPRGTPRNTVPDPAMLGEDSIRWFLQSYLNKTLEGSLYIRKNESRGVSTLKMRGENLTELGALMMRLANISFYRHGKLRASANPEKKNLGDCYVFPATETWKLLSIIPASASSMTRQTLLRCGDHRFPFRHYVDALKYRGCASDVRGAKIVSRTEVEDWVLEGVFPDTNGFVTRDVREEE